MLCRRARDQHAAVVPLPELPQSVPVGAKPSLEQPFVMQERERADKGGDAVLSVIGVAGQDAGLQANSHSNPNTSHACAIDHDHNHCYDPAPNPNCGGGGSSEGGGSEGGGIGGGGSGGKSRRGSIRAYTHVPGVRGDAERGHSPIRTKLVTPCDSSEKPEG